MDAVKFLKEKKRMTDGCNATYCKTCALSISYNRHNVPCSRLQDEHPDKVVAIVERWSEEHPQKTRQTEFLKAHPKATLDYEGILMCCPKHIEGWGDCFFDECKECREGYWSEKMRDELQFDQPRK